MNVAKQFPTDDIKFDYFKKSLQPQKPNTMHFNAMCGQQNPAKGERVGHSNFRIQQNLIF